MCNLSKPNFIGDSSEPNYRRKIIDSVILLPFFVTIRVCFCGLVHVDNGALISYRMLSNAFEHLKMLVFFVFVSKYDYSGINGLEENLRTNYACWDLSQSTISKKTTLTITLRFFFWFRKKNWFVSLRFSYIHSIKAWMPNNVFDTQSISHFHYSFTGCYKAVTVQQFCRMTQHLFSLSYTTFEFCQMIEFVFPHFTKCKSQSHK